MSTGARLKESLAFARSQGYQRDELLTMMESVFGAGNLGWRSGGGHTITVAEHRRSRVRP